MKILKISALIFLLVIVSALIIAAFTDKDYAVKREIVINREKAEVFDYIKYLKNQDNWSRWSTMDPNMIKSYKGTDGQVGFVSFWDSNDDQVGTGEQEITKIIDGQRIETELRFLKPFESTEFAYMEVESISGNKTRVIWGFDGHMDYPMNLMLVAMDFDSMLGEDFEYGLNKLKKILESEASY